MPTIQKVEIEPRQPTVERKPKFSPSANPGYLWLENPPPWLEIEHGDSARCTGDAGSSGAS
jgi:hypothetical protein